MPARERLLVPPALLLLLVLSACDKPTTPTTTPADPGAPASEAELAAANAEESDATTASVPFADAQLFFELNSTDNDLGLQLFLDTDDGWKRVRVLDPARRGVIEFETAGRLSEPRDGTVTVDMRGVVVAPMGWWSGDYEGGEDRFRGQTVEGDFLASNATRSHDFPPPPSITPSDGEVVDPRNLVVEWNAPEAEQVEVIIEQDELEHILDVTLSSSTRRLRVPPQFLQPGFEYKIEILTIAENGNRVIAEGTFRTAP